MNCFHHQDRPAVGSCVSCQRALCTECAADRRGLLACKSRCEVEVDRIAASRQSWLEAPALQLGYARRRQSYFQIWGWSMIILGSLLALAAFANPAFRQFDVFVLLVLVGMFMLYNARIAVHIPPQFCRKCGYDLSGAASESCPECGAAKPRKR